MIEETVWNEVREFYEQAYKIKFKKRPTDINIVFLISKKKQLEQEIIDFYDRQLGPRLKRPS